MQTSGSRLARPLHCSLEQHHGKTLGRDDSVYATFKVLGILLTYPEESWLKELSELQKIVETEGLLDDAPSSLRDLCKQGEAIQTNGMREHLKSFFEYLKTEPLLHIQEQYVAWFDRTPSLSLYLFEHVHGESRDRGQAMVDLLSLYQKSGVTLKNKELPDYLPVFLEFLSGQSLSEALKLLHETSSVISAIGKRLKQKEIVYHEVFDALETVCNRHCEEAQSEAKGRRSNPELDWV